MTPSSRFSKAVINPQKARKDPDLPSHALMVFTSQDLKRCRLLLDDASMVRHSLFLAQLYLGNLEHREVALVGPMIGAPQAVLVLEKLIALGVRHVIAYGWCGSIQKRVDIGDIVLPVNAVSEEGTSSHYPISKSAGVSSRLLNSLKNRLVSLHDVRVHEGSVWSTDAPYRETEEKVLRYQSRGVLAVEMEMAALMTVSIFRGIDFAGVLVVSDDLANLSWRHGFRNPRFLETRKRLPPHLFEALLED